MDHVQWNLLDTKTVIKKELHGPKRKSYDQHEMVLLVLVPSISHYPYSIEQFMNAECNCLKLMT